MSSSPLNSKSTNRSSFAPFSAPAPPVAAAAIEPAAASQITIPSPVVSGAPSPAKKSQPRPASQGGNMPPSSGSGSGQNLWRVLLIIVVPAAVVGIASVLLVFFLRRRRRGSPADQGDRKMKWNKDAFYEVGRRIKHAFPEDPPHESSESLAFSPRPLPRYSPFRHLHVPSPPPHPPKPLTRSPHNISSNQDSSPVSSEVSSSVASSRCWFTYKELEEATEGFLEANKLGQGRYGCMYKGCLVANGKLVAIKLLKAGGWQNEQGFRAEVELINRVHHKHLISLVGCCITDSHKILVYNYVPNGSLEDHLHGSGSASLDWVSRLRIAVGAARGIAYLHEDCHPCIIHRDIRPGNILIDGNFEALVSGFGMARLASDSEAYLTTHVTGSIGYLAPEYISSGRLTDKSDVYAFGVVLLELVTGRKAVDPSLPPGKESLVEWTWPALATAESFDSLVDRRLHTFDEREMLRMIKVAEACIRILPSTRPKMIQVVRLLEGNDNVLRDLRLGTRGFSANYGEDMKQMHKKSESQGYSSDCSIETSEYGIAVSPSSSET